jgi:NTP pyrophosphatase (non-canonical NTP hydrolase)
MDFQRLIEETKKIRKRFQKESSNFDKRDRVLDLVEEVGELANAVLIVEKRKKKNITRSKSDIADAISDILFDLIILAEDYQIDLLADYERMLKALKTRIDKGEFS